VTGPPPARPRADAASTPREPTPRGHAARVTRLGRASARVPSQGARPPRHRAATARASPYGGDLEDC
ncbi:hypothetical protein, partial [Microbispora rosea]|uniref:hypothetical protein n=1 Tax=Microbispora rosea TaxID=58117 RepID=UPI0019501293